MKRSRKETFETIFSNCRLALGNNTWGRVLAALDEDCEPADFPDALAPLKHRIDLPGFIKDLARIEWTWFETKEKTVPPASDNNTLSVNPSLSLVPVSWSDLSTFIDKENPMDRAALNPADVHVMIWRHPKTGSVHLREAMDIDLLALKIIIEGIDPENAAHMGNIPVKDIRSALDRAMDQGLLTAPRSLIRRNISAPEDFSPFLEADIFTLQWHITQKCDLHCKHCYDRSDRTILPFETGVLILDDLHQFCRKMNVRGQVTFTGGNPLLYPHFSKIYKAASDHGFILAILGNPTPIREIEKITQIAHPSFFQISLEGLEAHNDHIRGKGHFKRSLAFLDQLKTFGIYTMVMLTLTRDNMDQVLPLTDLLRDKTDFFTFNRLSTVGEGADLLMPEKKDFQHFLRQYEAAAAKNPIMGIKDNLFNIIRKEKGLAPFGGCTGYGCGAAFNFMSLLPDGEMHACRKFPSPIGNILESNLFDIYHSEGAEMYRNGSSACRNCSLSLVCRGCLAITHSLSLDISKDKDPFCFI